ncbi:MAG: PTS sugar transporter subunit IIA [Elusimicrobiota bacterium]|jgi:PTS system nitrogen regulatory IIA component
MTLGWFRKKDGKAAASSNSSPSPSPAPAALNSSVRIGQLLTEDLILRLPAGKTKEQLIKVLIERLCRIRKLGDPGRFYAKVIEREQGMSTTLDTGMAIPHARMDGLDSIVAVLGLLPQGLPDPKQPDYIIRAMCIFFSPNRQEVFTQHLHLLRGVSALFQPALLDEVSALESPAEVLRVLASREQ